MDRQEIIHRLKSLKDHAVHTPGEAPFIISLDDGIAICEAIELLKEQEPVAPAHSYSTYRCGKCGHIVGIDDINGVPGYKNRYCADCGKAVKWYD